MTYVISGANGAIGRRLVELLLAQGHRVRTLTRKPLDRDLPSGSRSFVADLNSPEFDPELFAGVAGAFLFPAYGSLEGFLTAARAQGVGRVVVLSSLAAAQEFPRDLKSPSALHHLAVERAVLASGLGFTILRPGTFANNLRQWAPTIRAQGMVFGPYPESSQALIHEFDIADVAALALTQPGHQGQVYALTGPESLTQFDQLKTIGSALGRDLRFQKIAPDQFRQSMAQFVPDAITQMLLDYWSDTVTAPDLVRDTVERLTGHPARTLADWARDHVQDF